MSRKKEPMTFSGSLEVQAQKPLDARTKVDTKADLTDAASFPYAYEGMTVYVVAEKKEYMLVGADTTTLSNWREKGAGGGTVDQTYDATSENAQSGTAVAGAIANKADQSSVVALQNTTEQLRTDIGAVDADLTQFKADYVIDMASKQTMAVINWQYEFFYAELLEMLKCGGAVVEWGNQTYMSVVGFEDKVVEGDRVVNAFAHNTASADGISLYWFTWTVAETDKETVKMSPDGSYHEVTAVGVPWVAAQLSYKQDKLVSGQNIKTINGNDITGEGNIQIRSGVGDEYDLTAMPSYNEIVADIANHNLRYIGGNWEVRSIAKEASDITLTAVYSNQKREYKFEENNPDAPLPEPWTFYDGYTNDSTMSVSISPDKTISHLLGNGGYARYTLYDDRIEFTQRQATGQTPFTKSYTIGANFEVGVEKWQGTYTEDGVTYQVYSKLVKIDALPSAAGVTGYPHGITGIKQILQAYGFTTDGFVLNAPRQSAADNIAIYQVQKAGNIQIEVGKDRSNKSALVCLVYAKNN